MPLSTLATDGLVGHSCIRYMVSSPGATADGGAAGAEPGTACTIGDADNEAACASADADTDDKEGENVYAKSFCLPLPRPHPRLDRHLLFSPPPDSCARPRPGAGVANRAFKLGAPLIISVPPFPA